MGPRPSEPPPRVSTDMDSLTVSGIPTCNEQNCSSPTVADQRRNLTGFPEELPCSVYCATNRSTASLPDVGPKVRGVRDPRMVRSLDDCSTIALGSTQKAGSLDLRRRRCGHSAHRHHDQAHSGDQDPEPAPGRAAGIGRTGGSHRDPPLARHPGLPGAGRLTCPGRPFHARRPGTGMPFGTRSHHGRHRGG